LPDALKAVKGVGTHTGLIGAANTIQGYQDLTGAERDTAAYWHALRTLGISDRIEGLGRLLSEF
jgi:maleate isomerase